MKVDTYNLTYFILILLPIAALIATYFCFKGKNDKTKRIFLSALCIFNIVLFFVYKGFLSVDKEFLIITGQVEFNWFSELPLQLCNINMILIPIGILTDCKPILGFSFYLAPLGALMALLFPEPAFIGYSLLVPRIAGYYFTHLIIMYSGIALAVLGIFKPQVKSIPTIAGTFITVAFLMHCVNMLLRSTVCNNANYFYTVEPAGISLLELFWKLLPIPFFYELPALIILGAYMALVSLVFLIIDKVKKNG